MASSILASQRDGLERGRNSTTLEVIFGGGVKAEGGTSNRILVSQRQFASTPRRP